MIDHVIKWGIMATGKIAHTFSAAVNFVPNAVLYACSSRTYEKAKSFAENFGIHKAYASYEDLASDPDVDIIYIASPMSCHYENIKLCLEHGKNVLCEKSITINEAQLAELINIAKNKKLFFMEAMWMKFMPSFLTAKNWVNQNIIGEIKTIRADFSCPVGFDPNDRLFRPELGGGALLDLGVYTTTFIHSFLGGAPKNISSAMNIGGLGVDMDGAAIFDFDNAYASTVFGYDIENDNRAIIVGAEGRMVFNSGFFCTDTVCLYDKTGKLVVKNTVPHEYNGYEYEIYEVQRCLAQGLTESPLNPLNDTVEVMRIMDRIRKENGFSYPEEDA